MTCKGIYKCTDYCRPASEAGVAWNAPDLDIDWHIEREAVQVSEKDGVLPCMKNQAPEKLPLFEPPT